MPISRRTRPTADPEVKKLIDKAEELKATSERLIEQARKLKEQADKLIVQSEQVLRSDRSKLL